jgi:hypothetical protein
MQNIKEGVGEDVGQCKARYVARRTPLDFFYELVLKFNVHNSDKPVLTKVPHLEDV